MLHSSSHAADSNILNARKNLSYHQGRFTYELRLEQNRALYSVTDGNQRFETQLDWALGSGKMGQAYLFWRNGSWYETQVTYYGKLNNLARMLGGKPISDFEEAIGERLPDEVARGCFVCHTSGYNTDRITDANELTPGIQCQQCHVGSEAHVVAAVMNPDEIPQMEILTNLSAEAASELCGKCHRTWSNVILNGPRGLESIRFQPYRLANSKCYDGSDSRISCVTCHNPHHELQASAAFYDAKCLACHLATGQGRNGRLIRSCPVGTENCASCHMPKYALPNTIEEFTDHEIRVVRPNQPIPD
jgi:hypothetical protein